QPPFSAADRRIESGGAAIPGAHHPQVGGAPGQGAHVTLEANAPRAAARDSRDPPLDPVERAIDHLISLQYPTGYWEAEMVWNSMLLSQYVIVRRIIATHPALRAGAQGRWPIDEQSRQRIIQ